MAWNFEDETQVKQFKTMAASKGFDDSEIESFIQSKKPQKPENPLAMVSGKINISETGDVVTPEAAMIPAQPTVQEPVVDAQLPMAATGDVQMPKMEIPPQNNEVMTGVEELKAPNLMREPVQQQVPYTDDVRITQQFGNPNAKLYGRSKSGRANINRGVDIAASPNEPQYAPPEGNWIVQKAVDNGKFNTGWGNYVVILNKDTGETIRRSHLDKVNVRTGQVVTGKQLGTTGRTGRTTGYHMDIEYTNPKGQLADYTKSPYFKYTRVKQ